MCETMTKYKGLLNWLKLMHNSVKQKSIIELDFIESKEVGKNHKLLGHMCFTC